MTDFAAFKEYLSLDFDEDTAFVSVARHTTASPNGPHASRYLFLNIEEASQPEFREISAEVLSRQFKSAAMPQKDVDAVLMNLRSFGSILRSQQTNLDPETVLKDAEKESVLPFAGGGAAIPKASMFITDSRTVEEFHKTMFPDMSEADRAFGISFVNHHEASHLILGLGEPGADYMAAALTLRDHPDARTMLRSWADLRLLQGITDERASDPYGSECHDAIEQVLNMPPEQLQTMSLEQLYAGAKQFDAANDRNNRMPHSAEDNLRDSLKGWDVGRGLKFLWNKVSHFEIPDMDDVSEHFSAEHVTPKDIDSKIDNLSFAENSQEARLANDVRESMTRARQNHMLGR